MQLARLRLDRITTQVAAIVFVAVGIGIALTLTILLLESKTREGRLVMALCVFALAVVPIAAGLLLSYTVWAIVSPLSAIAAAVRSFDGARQEDRAVVVRGPREIVQVADALNEMTARIRALVDDRTRMLAAISHDLRTPLTRLRLRAERVPPEAREGILYEIQRIGRMLDETLEYLRQDLRPEPVERVDLASLLRTICTEFSDVGHDVSYLGPAHLPYSCRPSALTRAITNLVDNATKHGSSVAVRLHTRDVAAEIEVRDDGPGIPSSLRDQVFDPFFRIDARSARAAAVGFGLGLTIARDIIRGHGGTLELLDGKPHGLLVRVLLPRLSHEGEQPHL